MEAVLSENARGPGENTKKLVRKNSPIKPPVTQFIRKVKKVHSVLLQGLHRPKSWGMGNCRHSNPSIRTMLAPEPCTPMYLKQLVGAQGVRFNTRIISKVLGIANWRVCSHFLNIFQLGILFLLYLSIS